MAKYKLQEMSDMRDEGKRRVYPKMVPYRTLSRKEVRRTDAELSS